MAKDALDKPRRDDKLRRMAMKPVDTETGQPLFKPQLIQNDQDEGAIEQRKALIKNEGGIGNYLYN